MKINVTNNQYGNDGSGVRTKQMKNKLFILGWRARESPFIHSHDDDDYDGGDNYNAKTPVNFDKIKSNYPETNR